MTPSSTNPIGNTTRTLTVMVSLIHIHIRREFMTRTERYKRGLAMTNRIYELQESHNWSDQETAAAFSSLDEHLPINLHNIGMYHSHRGSKFLIFYSKPSSQSSSRKVLQILSQNTVPSFQREAYSGATCKPSLGTEQTSQRLKPQQHICKGVKSSRYTHLH